MQLLNLSSSADSSTIIENFRNVLEQTAIILNKFNVKAAPYKHSELRDYSNLTVEAKKIALKDASTYLQVLNTDLDQEENNQYSEGQSLWLALKFFGLRPTSDVFEHLTKQDAIELYSAEGIQLWRNFKFMEVCSYTLEEIFCYTWQERYERDETATQKIIEVISNFSLDNPKTVRCSIKNLLKEKFSVKKLTIDVCHEHLSPVFDYSNRPAGFISSSKVNIISN